MSELDLADIQGLILRGYNMPYARLFVLRVDSPAAAKRFLGSLVDGASAGPQITSAAPWAHKPACGVNLGLTFHGLRALGLPDASLASFPPEFAASPLGRADDLGDTGDSAPETWIGGLAWTAAAPSQAHVLLGVFARDGAALERESASLRRRFTEGGALVELAALDAVDLPDSRVHFGYVDGLSQPRIVGGPSHGGEDDQPPAPTGEFLLGYPNQYGTMYPLPTPTALGKNGTYAAFRILRQDVDAFEAFLTANAPQIPVLPGVNPREKLAAKLCGRWRNGVPLALSPETDTPTPAITEDRINAFDYVPSPAYPGIYDDGHGARCPLGSHMRRSNPRGGRVAGGGNHLHRVLRRGLPYGPVYDPARPHDGKERGLMGVFLCASLKDQFEFLMTEWVNGDSFGLNGDLDPLLGNNPPGTSRFQVPVAGEGPIKLTGFGRFVTTRGSAYGFLPSVTAIRFLADS